MFWFWQNCFYNQHLLYWKSFRMPCWRILTCKEEYVKNHMLWLGLWRLYIRKKKFIGCKHYEKRKKREKMECNTGWIWDMWKKKIRWKLDLLVESELSIWNSRDWQIQLDIMLLKTEYSFQREIQDFYKFCVKFVFLAILISIYKYSLIDVCMICTYYIWFNHYKSC